MKIISNKEYNKLFTEIEVLKWIRENNEWYCHWLQNRVNELETEVSRLHWVIAEQNKLLEQMWYFDE